MSLETTINKQLWIGDDATEDARRDPVTSIQMLTDMFKDYLDQYPGEVRDAVNKHFEKVGNGKALVKMATRMEELGVKIDPDLKASIFSTSGPKDITPNPLGSTPKTELMKYEARRRASLARHRMNVGK